MGIEFKGVAKTVGPDVHIHPIDLQLNVGGFNILLGTTLSGKTTLLRLMAGLEKPVEGEVWFDGVNVTGVPVQQRNVSMVYQQFINYPNLNVYDNIASPLKVLGMAHAEIRRRVDVVVELLKLSPMLMRMPHELSGGQQQRTALARALVKDSNLVLLDEPLANLDYKLREELRDELPRLFADKGATVVYATTEPGEALLLGGHTATLHEGKLTQFGETADIYRTPHDLISARVFSDPPINTALIEKKGDRFFLDQQTSWPVPSAISGFADGAYTMGFRPHYITLQAEHDHCVQVNGRVMVTEISGSESVIHISVGENIWVSQSLGVHIKEIGEKADLFINPGGCLYFDAQQRLIGGRNNG